MDKKYVIFKLGEEEFGAEITNIKEISPIKAITRIPESSPFMDGVVDLRGIITPIINLKKKFGIETRQLNEKAKIVISILEDKQTGFIVDEASQVIGIEQSNIVPVPDILSGSEKDYYLGMTKLGDRIILIVDLEKILSQ